MALYFFILQVETSLIQSDLCSVSKILYHLKENKLL